MHCILEVVSWTSVCMRYSILVYFLFKLHINISIQLIVGVDRYIYVEIKATGHQVLLWANMWSSVQWTWQVCMKSIHSVTEKSYMWALPYQCLKLSSTSSLTTGWLQFSVFPVFNRTKYKEQTQVLLIVIFRTYQQNRKSTTWI